MRKNNTFNKSKPEEDYFKMLCHNYGERNVKRQYKDNIRYPFLADFYIISEDLFIECNFHWTHNTHPFDENNRDDVNQLNQWIEKSNNSDFYKVACYVWTDLDVRKLNTARNNNLNFKFIYCTKEGENYEYVI